MIHSQLASASPSEHAETVITEYLIYNKSMFKSDVKDFVSLGNRTVLKKNICNTSFTKTGQHKYNLGQAYYLHGKKS